MFTGIVTDLGTVQENFGQLIVSSSFDTVLPGESIAVNGCCLTHTGGKSLRFDLSQETKRVTNLDALKPGDRVNLERAMAATDRFGGHWVTGHVDCIGTVQNVLQTESGALFRFQVEAAFDRYLISKGSVAIDGISLTVNDPHEGSFEAFIIPHTLEQTNLAVRRMGDQVNVEFDLFAKYVEKMLGRA